MVFLRHFRSILTTRASRSAAPYHALKLLSHVVVGILWPHERDACTFALGKWPVGGILARVQAREGHGHDRVAVTCGDCRDGTLRSAAFLEAEAVLPLEVRFGDFIEET